MLVIGTYSSRIMVRLPLFFGHYIMHGWKQQCIVLTLKTWIGIISSHWNISTIAYIGSIL